VLAGWLPFLRNGLFPNRFAPDGSAEYNSADAPLWFALAVRRYELAGGSPERIRQVFLPALRAIVEGMASGSELGSEDAGRLWTLNSRSSANSTWMDARVDGHPVTPRGGCPVEIAALWVFLRQYLALLEQLPGAVVRANGADARAKRSASTFRQ